MDFREINKTDSSEFGEAMAIYVEAFPANERHPVSIISDRVRQGLNRLYVGSINNEIAFLALLWPLKKSDFILLDYIATKDKHRGKGIASAFLGKLRTELMSANKHLILEVENPNFGDNIQEKKKRVTFYKNHGAKELEGVRYLLPPLDGSTPTEMILMLFPEYEGEKLSSTVVRTIITQIYLELYGRQEDDTLLGTFVHDIANDIKLI
jgi:GNAT superfamily N-acetyltransferase